MIPQHPQRDSNALPGTPETGISASFSTVEDAPGRGANRTGVDVSTAVVRFQRALRWTTAGLLIVAIGLAVFVASVTHDAPVGHYNGHMGTLQPDSGKPDNVPTWAEYRTAPAAQGCHVQREGELADTVVVVDQDNRVRRMGTDVAEERATSSGWVDDVVVIGVC